MHENDASHRLARALYPGLLVLEGLPSVRTAEEAERPSEPAPDSEAVRAPAADRACARGG